MRKAWTRDEDAKLLTLRTQGASFKACGKSIGRTECSCINRYSELRNAKQRSNPADASLWTLWCLAEASAAARRCA